MTRSSLPRFSPRGAVASVVVLMVLVGCAGDNGDDGIAGVDDAATSNPDEEEPSDDAEPSSDDDAVDRPDVRVADSLEMIFEEVETEDAVEEQVIRDSELQILSVYEVVTDHGAESSVSFYTAEEAFLWDMDFLESVMDRGLTSTGTMRYFNQEVVVLSEDTASVTYCRDYREVATADFETGEVTEEADDSAPPTFYETFLRKNDEGVWQTVAREYDQESGQC